MFSTLANVCMTELQYNGPNIYGTDVPHRLRGSHKTTAIYFVATASCSNFAVASDVLYTPEGANLPRSEVAREVRGTLNATVTPTCS